MIRICIDIPYRFLISSGNNFSTMHSHSGRVFIDLSEPWSLPLQKLNKAMFNLVGYDV